MMHHKRNFELMTPKPRKHPVTLKALCDNIFPDSVNQEFQFVKLTFPVDTIPLHVVLRDAPQHKPPYWFILTKTTVKNLLRMART